MSVAGPRQDRETLRRAYLESWIQNQRRFHAARPVIEALLLAGIDVLLLKGRALLRFYDDDPGLRPMRDLDVLVRTCRAVDAMQILGRLDYRPAGIGIESLGGEPRRRFHGWSFIAPQRPEIDLHWHALDDARADRDDDDFWSAAVPLEIEGLSVKALCTADQLLHVCAHGMRPDKTGDFHWIPDAVLILRGHARELDWDRLIGRVLKLRLVPQMRFALGYLARRFAAPIPRPVLRTLARERATPFERLEFRALKAPPSLRNPLSQAVLAYQLEVRGGTVKARWTAFARYLLWHFWGAEKWWQMPVWTTLDLVGIHLPVASRRAKAVFRGPPPNIVGDDVPAYHLGETLAFSSGGNGIPFLRGGWGPAEPGGSWTDEALAQVILRPERQSETDLLLLADIVAALVPTRRPLKVDVLFNGSRVQRWRFDSSAFVPRQYSAIVPHSLIAGERLWSLALRVLGRTSPAALGLSEDARLLGVHLRSLCLLPMRSTS